MNTKPNVTFIENFAADADELYRLILERTVWDERMNARLTASYGAPYNYSNMTYPATPMPRYLGTAVDAIEKELGWRPNNCLINNYVEGSSRMGFHADSTAELEPGTGVAIVSLGETRTLTFRRTDDHEIRWGCPLPHGCLLWMNDEVQAYWQHGVLKQSGAGQRVSLTFRALKEL